MNRFILMLALLCAVTPAWAMMPISFKATVMFTGNCLPCLENDLRGLGGVVQVNRGFVNDPHRIPVIRVLYDPRVVSYGRVLQGFWTSITNSGASQKANIHYKNKRYVAGIFTLTSPQTEQAKRLLIREAEERDVHIPVLIRPAPVFYFESQKAPAAR